MRAFGTADPGPRAGIVLLSLLLLAFLAFGALLRGWILASDALALRHEMASLMNQADRLAEDLELELSFIEENLDPDDPRSAAGFLSGEGRWPGIVRSLYALEPGLSPFAARVLSGQAFQPVDRDDPLSLALAERTSGEGREAPAFRILSALSREGTWRLRAEGDPWLLLRLDDEALAERVLPELGARYFGAGTGFDRFAVRALNLNGAASLPLGSLAAARLPAEFWDSREFSRPLLSTRARRGVSLIYAAARDPEDERASPPPPPGGEFHSAPRGNADPAPPSFPIDVFRFAAPDRQRGWILEANYRQGGFEEALRARALRDTALAFSFLAALYGLIAGLVLSAGRAASLAARERAFVASVSHELKTPVAVLISAADNLAKGIVPPERAAQYGQTLAREGRRLRDAVESILLASGIQGGLPARGSETFPLEEALRSAMGSLGELAASRGASIDLHIKARPLVKASRALVESAIASLLSNALKYGPMEGRVDVTLASGKRRGRRLAILCVADRGPGLQPGERRRLFTAFWRGAGAAEAGLAGTGLGLYLTRRIARMNGGDISWKARPGGGSVFCISIQAEIEA